METFGVTHDVQGVQAPDAGSPKLPVSVQDAMPNPNADRDSASETRIQKANVLPILVIFIPIVAPGGTRSTPIVRWTGRGGSPSRPQVPGRSERAGRVRHESPRALIGSTRSRR